MTPRLVNAWHKVHTSFWFVPALMAALSAGLAYAAVLADRVYEKPLSSLGWLWGGSPDAARDMLSTIASSMITVAGVTFSVTVVALTMAAAQFGPRLLRNFMRDTGNQLVMGTFVSTFLFCLLVLRAVRGGEDQTFVPQLAATTALLFAVVAVGVLIYFIHHVATSLQVENLVASIADELAETIDNLFPEELGKPVPEELPERDRQAPLAQAPWRIAAPETGYVQAIETERMMALAVEHDLILRVLRRPGGFIDKPMPILEVWPAERRDEELGHRLARMFSVGRHRTTTQDVEYPVQQIVSVALRALSPAINDPVSAMICIDWLGNGMLRLAGRRIPSAFRSDAHGHLRVIAPTTDFAELADLSFNPIRRAARQHPEVLLRMLEQLHTLALHAPRPGDRRAIRDHLERIRVAALDAGFDASEQERLGAKCRLLRDVLDGGKAPWPGKDGQGSSSDST